jgi:hypothetical protein
VMLRPWYGARGRKVADGPPDRRGARPAGTACAVRRRMAWARTPARRRARTTLGCGQPRAEDVGRRAGADAEGAGPTSRRDVATHGAAGPFSIC